jgi:hypothetical protein
MDDRGFPSYDLYVKTLTTGADLLWRVSASFELPVITRLTDGTYLSELRGNGRGHRRVTEELPHNLGFRRRPAAAAWRRCDGTYAA